MLNEIWFSEDGFHWNFWLKVKIANNRGELGPAVDNLTPRSVAVYVC